MAFLHYCSILTAVTSCTVAIIVFVSIVVQASYPEPKEGETSDCLKECLKPILKFERTFTFQFRNFEKICDKLDAAAMCSRKCSPADQQRFYHYTTFYRLHCIDFYEDLEDHLDCLKEAAPDADKTCNKRCTFKNGELDDKASKIKNRCRTLECSFVCYYQLFSNACTEMHETLLRLNMRQIDDMRMLSTPNELSNMQDECRRLHDRDYMKQQMLGT